MATTKFIGSFEHSLDVKGRLILPVKFRAPFADGGYLSLSHGPSLALWTAEEFELQMGERLAEAKLGEDQRNVARVWAAGSCEIEMDRQGRMAIPAELRRFAALTGEVLVKGAIDRVELWDPATWQERVAPAERLLVGTLTAPPGGAAGEMVA